MPGFQPYLYFLSYSNKISRNTSPLFLRTEERDGLRTLPCLLSLSFHLAHSHPLDLKVTPEQEAVHVLPKKRREIARSSKCPSFNPWQMGSRASFSSGLLRSLCTTCIRISGLPIKIAHAWAPRQIYQAPSFALIIHSPDFLVHIKIWEPLSQDTMGVRGQEWGVVVTIKIWIQLYAYFYVKFIRQGWPAHGPRPRVIF